LKNNLGLLAGYCGIQQPLQEPVRRLIDVRNRIVEILLAVLAMLFGFFLVQGFLNPRGAHRGIIAVKGN